MSRLAAAATGRRIAIMTLHRTALVLACVTAACSTNGSARTFPGSQMHVVAIQLRDDMPAAERSAIRPAFLTAAAQLDGIVGVFFGDTVPSDRPVALSGFDLLCTMHFRDAAAAAVWQEHPAHVDLLARFRPWFARIAVIDGKEPAAARAR
jgi:hypothetical protein